jgi:hypothetical protein
MWLPFQKEHMTLEKVKYGACGKITSVKENHAEKSKKA